MSRKNRTQLILGILLILVAAWLIASRAYPALNDLVRLPPFAWPMWMIAGGAGLLLLGLLVGAPGMAVPAFLVAGIGGILYYQNQSGDWSSWSYMWTLIPGFAGLGTILAGLLGENTRHSLRSGLNGLVASLILFALFGTLFGAWAAFGPLSSYLPIGLLFLLGLWLVVRGLLPRK